MIEIVIRYDEETERACFDLLNRKEEIIPFEKFDWNFKEGIKKGQIYVEYSLNKIVSYMRGEFGEKNGFRYFNLQDFASTNNYMKFAKEVRKLYLNGIEYIFYWRKRSNNVYMAIFFPGNIIKFKKVCKGGNVWLQ